MTPRTPGSADATTGVPQAIDSISTIPNASSEVTDGSTVTAARAVEVAQIVVGHAAREPVGPFGQQLGGQAHVFGAAVAFAGEHDLRALAQPALGHRRQQPVDPLERSGLIHRSDEQHDGTLRVDTQLATSSAARPGPV